MDEEVKVAYEELRRIGRPPRQPEPKPEPVRPRLDPLRVAFASRLREAMTLRGHAREEGVEGLDTIALAEAVGSCREAARRWVRGWNFPNKRTMKLMASWLEVNTTWLRYGRGPMLRHEERAAPPTPEPAPEPSASPFSTLIAELTQQAQTKKASTPWRRKLIESQLDMLQKQFDLLRATLLDEEEE